MYDEKNIFARIIRNEVPNKTVYEDDYILAFHDANPAAPIHILIIPKEKFLSFDDFSKNADSNTIKHFFSTIQKIAEQKNLTETGYRLITNHGKHASQSVPHFHVHLLGGQPLGGLLSDDNLIR